MMNGFFMQFGVIYILITALMAARPWFSRKNVLFGVVFGSSEIRTHPETRKTVGRFVVFCIVLAAALASVFLLILNIRSYTEEGIAQMFVASVFILVLIETIPYITANRSMKILKAAIVDENLVRDSITVELGAEQAKKPVHAAWFLLLLVPVAITIAVAAYYYPQMQDRIPTDAWANKSAGFIMTPVTGQIILAAILIVAGVFSRNATSSVKGNPGAAPKYPAFRRFLSYWIIGFGLVVETQFILGELEYAGIIANFYPWIIISIVLIVLSVLVLIIGYFRMVQRQEPTGKVYDDDSKWALGMFYFNPSDPSIFVEKRSGIGQTLNFGRPAAWIVIAGIILFIIIAKTFSG